MSFSKIVLIGADGQLGTDLHALLKPAGEQLVPLYYPEFDLTRPEAVKKVLSELAPTIVINTAAYNRVDDCEDEPQAALDLNAIAVRDLAIICRDLECVLVHFSTDYVFDGKKTTPYIETDVAVPISVYAVSKLAGEFFVSSLWPRHILIRTCGLYGEAGCWGKGHNFVDTMVSLADSEKTLRIVADQCVTPTSTWELAQKVIELLGHHEYGLYHLSNEGECTWFEFAREIFSLLGKGPDMIPVDSATYGAKAARPAYSVLENKRAKELGLSDFSPWKDALKDYLIRKGHI
jgi:dTDP-4-dehydrorhamnose reductase